MEERAKIPVALTLVSRLLIAIERIEILSSIGRLAAPFREDLPALPDDDMILAADASGDASLHMVDADLGYGI